MFFKYYCNNVRCSDGDVPVEPPDSTQNKPAPASTVLGPFSHPFPSKDAGTCFVLYFLVPPPRTGGRGQASICPFLLLLFVYPCSIDTNNGEDGEDDDDEGLSVTVVVIIVAFGVLLILLVCFIISILLFSLIIQFYNLGPYILYLAKWAPYPA